MTAGALKLKCQHIQFRIFYMHMFVAALGNEDFENGRNE
jgi:hypothetical protein